MHDCLKASKSFTRHFILILIGLSIIACARKDTAKPSYALEPSSGESTENVIPDRETPDSLTPDDISLNDTSGGAKIDALHAEPSTDAEPSIDAAYGGDYVVGPEDLLEISVYQVDELNRTVRVSSSGYIKLPLAGKIMSSGLTVPELEAEIGKRLEPYLQEPLVSIFIREYRSQSITILGGVKQPKVHIVTRQKHLLDIITLSGGLTNDAGDICYVRRESETIIINIHDLLVNGDIRLNVPVFSGDIIHVPIGGILFVDGAVRSPGSFGMRGTITLTQAVAMARGFRYEAIKSKIRIYRDSGKPEREVIDIDYDAILANKSPDLILKDKDIVIVPESGAKKMFNTFVESLRGSTRIGAVSVGGGL